MFFSIKTKIRRALSNILDLNRPSSYPFISGDGFRSLAQHHFDEISNMNPIHVQNNDIVFVRSDFLKEFFKNKHPLIKSSYILISHNDDTNITSEYEKYLDGKITHWFAENLCFKHPKITPIPIGLENLRYNSKGKLSYFDQKDFKKEDYVYIKYNFSLYSDAERICAEENLKKSSLAKKIEPKDQGEYIENIKISHFVASPRGRGIDCHRTWEAMYLKTMPIVLKNEMTKYFKEIGLPLLLIDSWDDIKKLTTESLRQEYQQANFENWTRKELSMDYWCNEIVKYKK